MKKPFSRSSFIQTAAVSASVVMLPSFALPAETKVKKNIEYSQSFHVYLKWNCPMSDTEDEGFETNFNSVKYFIRNIDLKDLYNEYPWCLFFTLLSKAGYTRYCDADVAGNPDPVRFMRY